MHFFHHYSVFFYADYGILCEELLVRAKKTQVVLHIITSGKNFIKITSVGMGAAKSNETR